MTINPDDLLRELLQTFQAEAAEHLQTLNLDLLSLEVRPDETHRQELLQEAFRAAHSLKGAARAVSLDQIEQLAHAMESVLEEARDAGKHLPAGTFDVLYDVLDNIGHLLEGKTVDVEPLVIRLTQSAAAVSEGEVPAAETMVVDAAQVPESVNPVVETVVAAEALVVSQPIVAQAAPAPVAVVASSNGVHREPPAVKEPPASQSALSDEPATRTMAVGSEETIRVAIAKLDNLMAQVGELLVTRMNAEQRGAEVQVIRHQFSSWPKVWREIKTLLPQIDSDAGKRLSELLTRYQEQLQGTLQDVNRFDRHLRQDTLRLGVIASQLQDSVRHVRMVPFETLVPVFQRAVRDTARIEAKQVVFNVSGGEVELDKKVLEALKDPFLHMLSNAVGHGIESPEDRVKLGKSAEGHVTLTVQQRGAEVRITVSDDGAGFDLSGLRRAGKGKSGYQLDERASTEDIVELAFLPGVTTSHEVTSISGRGVGLDVVRQRLEALQGRIQVDTAPGKGSSIHLVVPTTLTISRGLLVLVGEERYVLPMLSVEKIIELHKSFSIEGQTMITVDGSTLPLVSLAGLLERPATTDGEQNALAVVMGVAEQRLALVVDDVLTEQELAVKPLGKPLHRVRNVAGAALMGDGKPVVILNAADLVRAAKGLRKRTEIQSDDESQQKRNAHILVVDDSITTRTLEKNILETAGYEITTATDGAEALRRLKEQHVDLVVSDVQMPNMDGIALTRHLRESRDFKDLPLILVTSLESREDRERGMIAGANAYIVKRGFDQAELLKTVQQLVFVEEA